MRIALVVALILAALILLGMAGFGDPDDPTTRKVCGSGARYTDAGIAMCARTHP